MRPPRIRGGRFSFSHKEAQKLVERLCSSRVSTMHCSRLPIRRSVVFVVGVSNSPRLALRVKGVGTRRESLRRRRRSVGSAVRLCQISNRRTKSIARRGVIAAPQTALPLRVQLVRTRKRCVNRYWL